MYKLAVMLGKSISEIENMPASEYREWLHYISLEPRGEDRLDWNSAQITQAIYSGFSAFGKNNKQIDINDCLLKFEICEKNEESEAEKYKKKAIKTAMIMSGILGKPEILEKVKKGFK